MLECDLQTRKSRNPVGIFLSSLMLATISGSSSRSTQPENEQATGKVSFALDTELHFTEPGQPESRPKVIRNEAPALALECRLPILVRDAASGELSLIHI